MKSLKILVILLVVAYSISVVSAASISISATGQTFWSVTPSPGSLVTVTINFQSAANSTLYLYRIGLHMDWQDSGMYYSQDYSSSPRRVEANGLYSTAIPILVPEVVTVGQHSLIISADGYDSNGNLFYWDSSLQHFSVASSSNISPAPTATANPAATITVTPAPTPMETATPTPTPKPITPSPTQITPSPTPNTLPLTPTPTTPCITPTPTSIGIDDPSQTNTINSLILIFIVILALIAVVSIVAIVAIMKR